MNGAPSGDELAAIVIALAASRSARPPATHSGRRSVWALAAHYPELEFDELRALARAPQDRVR